MSAARTPSRTSPNTAGWIAIIVFVFLAGVGAIAALAAVVRVQLARLEPGAAVAADELRPAPGDDHLRPDRQDRAGPLRRRQARGRHLRRDPQGPARRDDRGRGQDLLGQRRASIRSAIVSAGARLAARRQPRRLDDHPAARPRSALLDPALVQDPHRTAERKLKEIIQSIRLTQAFQGDEGKQQIITAYLNQNYYGNQSYGVKAAVRVVLRHRPQGHHAGPGGDHRRPAQVPVELRPRPQRDREMPDRRRRGRPVPGRQAHRRPTTRRSSSGATRSSTCSPRATGRRCRAASTRSARLRRRQERARSCWPARPTPRWIAPHFVWAVRDELADEAVRRGRRPAPRSTTAVCGSRRRSTSNLQKIAEKWVQAAAIVPQREEPDGARPRRSGFEARAVDGEPARQGPPQRRARRARLPDRRARRLRRQPRTTTRRRSKPAVPAAVRRRRQGLPPAGFGVQAVQLR